MAFTPLFETGFEHKNTLVFNGSSYAISTVVAKTGTTSITLTNWCYWKVLPAQSGLYFGCWVYFVYQDSGSAFTISFCEASGGLEPISLRIKNHQVDLYVNNVLKASGSVYTPYSAWFNIQAHVIVSNTGLVETIIEGISDITYNGDTLITSNADIVSVRLDAFHTHYVDDICWGTGGWPGGRKYEKLTLNADHLAEWTPSAAADHYTLVDEVPYNDTDNVSTLLTAQTDLYGHSGWSSTGKVPTSMVVWLAIQKIEADTSQILFTIHEGATTLQSPATDINTSTQVQGYSFITAADASAWDDTHIDATFVGMESII